MAVTGRLPGRGDNRRPGWESAKNPEVVYGPLAGDVERGGALVPLSQVPGLPFIPRRRNGRKLHKATVFRWAKRGLRGVRLESMQFAGTKVTTVAAIQRFFSLLGENSPLALPTPSKGDT